MSVDVTRRRHLAALFTLAVCLFPASAAAAGPPGAGGVIASLQSAQLFGVAVQRSGEIVAAGQSGGRVLVERFTAAGALAGSFAGPVGYAKAVALQPDGKIVVAGSTGGAMLVERLTAGLTPDPTFGSSGVATTLGNSSGVANAVAVGPDGSIAVAGSILTSSTNTNFAAARFSSAGAVQWSEPLNFGLNSLASGLVVQPRDSKIVLVGRNTQGQDTNGVLARLNPDGSQDASFGGGAFTYHYPGGGYTTLTAVALQNNGQIVAGGVGLADNSNALFLRVNPNGSLDGGFGSGGAVALSSETNVLVPGDPIGAYGVGIAGGGRIVGAGNFENTGIDVDAALWAVTPGGAPDSGFGAGGIVRGPTGGYEACALALAPDGSLVTVGNTVSTAPDLSPCSPGGGSSAFVARYTGFGPPTSPAPPGSPPGVITGGASGVSQITARIAGQVNPHGLATRYEFQYGRTRSYGSATPAAAIASGGSSQQVAVTLHGLRPRTTYHYRLVASNSAGAGAGSDGTFTTQPALSSGLRKVLGSYRIASLRRAGLPLRVNCSQACSVKASLLISAKTAKRLKLGKRRFSLGNASGLLTTGGTTSLILRLSKRSRKALSHAVLVSATLQVTTTPVRGGPSVTLRKSIALKP